MNLSCSRRGFISALALFAACEVPTGVPPDAQRFTPPAVYRQWWALTEACSGLHGDFDAVQWYEVPNTTTVRLPHGGLVNAMWLSAGNRIVVAADPDGRYAGDLIRHEMLHALLRQGEHPRDVFIGRCGGVVACETECDAGPSAAPPVDPTALRKAPTDLQLGVEVTTMAPTPPDTAQYVMMLITARNPSSEPWQIELPPSGDAGAPASFSYILEKQGYQAWYDMRADAPEVTRFAPGETKLFIFDFWVRAGPTRYDIEPGTWTFRGAYGTVWSPQSPTLTLAP